MTGLAVEIPLNLQQLGPQLLSQGAEAVVVRVSHPYVPERSCIAKYRPPKPYRVEALDTQLRKKRSTSEARVLQKLILANIKCPSIVHIDTADAIIYMEYIDGATLKEFTWNSSDPEHAGQLFKLYGELVGKMHNLNISHGDLTTSNVLVDKQRELTLIDFGLSSMSANIEEKAVDLYVLERSIQSTHSEYATPFIEQVLEGYAATAKDGPAVMGRLQQVRQRGRKRSMLG